MSNAINTILWFMSGIKPVRATGAEAIMEPVVNRTIIILMKHHVPLKVTGK